MSEMRGVAQLFENSVQQKKMPTSLMYWSPPTVNTGAK